MIIDLFHLYQAFSGGLSLNRRILLDVLGMAEQNKPAAFNQAAGFDSLYTNRQTSRRYPLSGGVFTSAFPCCTFSYGEQGSGGLYARWIRFVQSVNPFLLFPALTFDSVKRGFENQTEKVHIMRKIRKGYSRPLISRSIRSFDSLADAGRFIDRLTASNINDYRFNIVQNGTRWTVCSVIGGEI